MISKITAIIVAIVTMISNLSGIIPSRQVYYNDVAYGTAERQVMDVCFPADVDKTEGVVLFIHGGAWMTGDKSSYSSRIQNISKTVGCITATMNYRYISGDVHCKDILKDISGALAKIKAMAETRGITCDKVMLIGASAGAHLSLLYAYTQGEKAPIKPCAVAAYSAPADLSSEKFIKESSLLPVGKTLQLLSYLTGTNLLKLNSSQIKSTLYTYSPIKYAATANIPTLVVHGKLDTVVPIDDTYRLVEKLRVNGVTHTFIELPDSGHGLDNDAYLMSKSDQVFVDFVNMYLK